VTDRQLTPEALMAKADTACSSARVLLNLDDVDGASNRAYYAMFDAARAALLASGAPVEPDIGRTHSSLIGAFGNFLVKNGPVSKDMGRLLNRAYEIRQIADYKVIPSSWPTPGKWSNKLKLSSPPCGPGSCWKRQTTTTVGCPHDLSHRNYAEVSNPPGVCATCGADRLIGHGRNEQVKMRSSTSLKVCCSPCCIVT
jgi:uncharacterized protein (UPF0332 family)